MPLPVIQPSRVTVMIKPVGALCNLDCEYCYYLPTKTIYDGHEHRMSTATLESIFASILPRFDRDVTIAWQGGEPTLAGLDFFRKAIEFQQKYAKPGQRIRHALQTNGTLLNDAWCVFLRENDFLIGLSIDGPPRFHDHYRVTNQGEGSVDKVLRGLRLLQKHAVEYNLLCVLNDVNVHHPDEMMRYLLHLGSRWLQFIPAIEWEPDPAQPGRNVLAPYSPDPEAYGRFLVRAFDLWFEKFRKRVSVRLFDAVLSKLVLGEMPFCILDGSCHNQLTIEHDGAVFGCDHFVERRWQYARIGEPGWENQLHFADTRPEAHRVGLTIHGAGYQKLQTHGGRDITGESDLQAYLPEEDAPQMPGGSPDGAPDGAAEEGGVLIDDAWFDRIDGERLGAFASRKQHLPEGCVQCEWKAYCHGGCPKHRSQGGDVPEPTILCESYKMFYSHAMPKLRWLADFIRQGQTPPDPEPAGPATAVGAGPGPAHAGAPTPAHAVAAGTQARPGAATSSRPGVATRGGPPGRGRRKIGRNEPCPCGSGLKYKHCHGR